MYYANKIVGAVANPLAVALLASIAGLLLAMRGRRRAAMSSVAAAVAWLWLWSTPMVYRWVGCSLEDEWPAVMAGDAPAADAIVLLGGGMSANTNICRYAEMGIGADRVWHAARLWKAGKAPVIVPSGASEDIAALPLLLDFGVPESAIVMENKARNTEENAKFVSEVLRTVDPAKTRKKVLLVTSAWHMRRSVLMFRKYAPELEIVPAAADYEATMRTGEGFSATDLLPGADCLMANSYCFKEMLGYWGYRLLR